MSDRGGWTLLESAILLCVVGVVLAVFVPTFISRLTLSKVSEATLNLSDMERRLAAYYDTAEGDAGGRRARHCLPVLTGPVPVDVPRSAVTPDFAKADDPNSAGFRAIGFAPTPPVRYRYTLAPRMAGCGLDANAEAVLTAEGDLDADGRTSRFERTLKGHATGGLVPTGILRVVDRLE